MTETQQQIVHGSSISGSRLPNLAIEGIFTFLFGPNSIRCCKDRKPIQTSASVKHFCILRSLNSLFWERSYEFVQSLTKMKELRVHGEVPPLRILQETRVSILHLSSLKDIGRLDLSSLLSVKDLELIDVYGHFSLTPPPNLERFKIEHLDIDLVDLIQGLKETKIIKLEIWYAEDIGRLDLSSLLSVKDLELWNVNGSFSLTPPPNLERFKINISDIDMVDLIQGLKETKIIKLEICDVKGIGRLDLSSLLSLKDLVLINVYGRFSLTPPPNLERFKINSSNIDMVDMIQGLKETKIIKLEICYAEDIGRLDLSSLLSVKDLVLGYVNGRFSLTPPPNLESFKFDDSDTDMVGFNHSEIWEPYLYEPDYDDFESDNFYADDPNSWFM